MENPKVSIITVVWNGEKHIEDCIKSVLSQKYPNIEYIVIDGASTDGTLSVVKKYEDKIAKIVSEPDKGLYDALNKGFRMATGDIIGQLNSDDVYAHPAVVEKVVSRMLETGADACWGNLVYMDENLDKVIRTWKSSAYGENFLTRIWMPPHPTFFVKKSVYERCGLFNTDMKIAADYELMVRFLEKFRISNAHVNDVLVKMRVGGISNRSLKNIIQSNKEAYNAWKVNGLTPPTLLFIKPFSKILQFI